MIRGKALFYCSNCKHRFIGLDIEYGASAFSAPFECPKCGSRHTRPWSLLPARIANMQYRPIWDATDRCKN